MKDNTARMSATDIVEHFKTTLGDLDLLKIFMVTGVTDISKSYELIAKLAKSADGTEQVEYENALKILGKIAVKRILVTETFYNSLNIGESAIIEPEAATFLMLPKLDDTLDRVRKTLKTGSFSSESYKEVMDVLNATVKQGKVINNEGQPITWSVEEINAFLDSYEKTEKKTAKKVEKKTTDKINFSDVFNLSAELAKQGKTAEEIEVAVKEFVLGKVVGGKDSGSDILMLDETIFKDFYSRMVAAYVTQAINKKVAENSVIETEKAISERIEKEVKPMLEVLDKDEKEVAFLSPSKLIMTIYKDFKSNIGIADAVKRVEEMAKIVAPKLFERHANAIKNKVPVDKKAADKAKSPIKEVYDDSHNIKESNKELWAEIEKYTLLSQLYDKGVELSKAGKWRDGICMCLTLIADGKIKETAESKEFINWDSDNVKLWYYNNIEMTVSGLDNKEPETIDVKAEIINDDTSKINASSKEAKIGPVPPAGFTQSKESVLSKLLKKREELKNTYAFKFVTIASDHHVNKSITFEVCDATQEQEPEMIGTEANLIKFIDLQRDELVKNSNAVKRIRQSIMDRLSTCYEMGHSEAKNIAAALNKEAVNIRKEIKKNTIAPANISSKVELKDADEGDEEGSTYYSELKVGALIQERKDGKKVPIEDGEWILIDDNNKDFNVITKNGIVMSMKPSIIDKGGQANPPVETANQVQDSAESKKDQVSQSTENLVKDNIISTTEKAATKLASNSSKVLGDPTQPAAEKSSIQNPASIIAEAVGGVGKDGANDAKNQEGPKDSKSEKSDSAGASNTSGGNNPGSAKTENAGDTKKVETVKISYEGFEGILNTHQRVDFQKAIFMKASTYSSMDEGKKAIQAVIDQARADNKWKKTFVRGYKNSPTVEVLAAVTNAIEAGVLAAANPV